MPRVPPVHVHPRMCRRKGTGHADPLPVRPNDTTQYVLRASRRPDAACQRDQADQPDELERAGRRRQLAGRLLTRRRVLAGRTGRLVLRRRDEARTRCRRVVRIRLAVQACRRWRRPSPRSCSRFRSGCVRVILRLGAVRLDAEHMRLPPVLTSVSVASTVWCVAARDLQRLVLRIDELLPGQIGRVEVALNGRRQPLGHLLNITTGLPLAALASSVVRFFGMKNHCPMMLLLVTIEHLHHVVQARCRRGGTRICLAGSVTPGICTGPLKVRNVR